LVVVLLLLAIKTRSKNSFSAETFTPNLNRAGYAGLSFPLCMLVFLVLLLLQLLLLVLLVVLASLFGWPSCSCVAC